MDLPNGITRQEHVEHLLQNAAAAISDVQRAVALSLAPSQREAFSRRLAGVIGDLESTRIWLAAGAPR